MICYSYRRVLLASAAAMMLAGHAQAVRAEPAQGITIEAQSLSAALLKLGQISGRNILFSPTLVRGKASHTVANTASIEIALHQMLTGTGLTYSLEADGAVVIEPAAARRTRAAADPGGGDEDVEAVVVTAERRQEDIRGACIDCKSR